MSAPDKQRILAIIPARGGSKGLPRKNLQALAGQPLIAHSIAHASEASRVGRCIVSTDDEEIARVSKGCGAEVLVRPAALSGDEASSESALVHVLDELARTERYEPDLVVFLQCTSPVRTADDVDAAIACLEAQQADSLLTVAPYHRFVWENGDRGPRSLNYDHRARQRRQDLPPQYVENGSIYVFKPWVLREHGNRLGGHIALYVMDELSAQEIDSALDLQIVELMMSLRGAPRSPSRSTNED